MADPADGGWIKWDGKRPFRGNAEMSVRFRNGRIAATHMGPTILPAHKWRGKWGVQPRGKAFPRNYEFDIVAVRIISQD